MLSLRAGLVLDAHYTGCMTDAEVESWAESELMHADIATIPKWLLDLVVFGVARFAKHGEAVAGRPSLGEQFAFRAARLDLGDRSQMERFALWIDSCGWAGSKELSAQQIEFCSRVSCALDPDLFGELGKAVGVVRTDLPPLLPSCHAALRRIGWPG